MNRKASEVPWTVVVEDEGRSSWVHYREGANSIRLYAEFLGGDRELAAISGVAAEKWDASFPWAKSRRSLILERIAREVIRQRAPGCAFEIREPEGAIVLLSR